MLKWKHFIGYSDDTARVRVDAFNVRASNENDLRFPGRMSALLKQMIAQEHRLADRARAVLTRLHDVKDAHFEALDDARSALDNKEQNLMIMWGEGPD